MTECQTLFQDAGQALNLPSTPSSSKANAKRPRPSPFATETSGNALFDAADGGLDKENALANNKCCHDRKALAEQ